jgi:DNA-binding Lrp family transcriptional regulator
LVWAFLLLECKKSFLEILLSEIDKIKGVECVYRIDNGPYDLILKIEASDRIALRDKVAEVVNLGHVYNTLSLIVI